MTILWQVLWWSQSSFHLIITHMTCLCVGKFSTSLPAFGPWTMNGYALYFDENYSCLTLERAVVCWQKQLNFLHRRCSWRKGWIFFIGKKKWKNTIVRSFRRNYRIYNDFGWYYLCWFIVGFHSFWKNYKTNTEYTSSKVDLFVVWIR